MGPITVAHLKAANEEDPSEDGGRVRRGDHLPPHRYIRNTSTRGTAPKAANYLPIRDFSHPQLSLLLVQVVYLVG